MKKFFLFLISLLIGLTLFILVGKTVGWQEIKKALLVFTGWHGITIFVLTILMALVGTWRWHEILKGLGAKISFRELWRVYLTGFSIRYLAPVAIVASEIFQGQVLRQINSIPWSRGMASIIIDRVLEWTTNLVVIFLGISFFLFNIGLPPMKVVIIFSSGIFLFTGLIIFFYFKSFKRESVAKAIGKIFNHRLDSEPLEIEKESFNFFKPKKKAMWESFGLSFLRAGIMLLRTWILILFFGKHISLESALSILSFSYLVTIIPIPASIGSHEAVQAFAFNSLGMGAGVGTAFTMVLRGAELILVFLGVIILFPLGLKLLKITIFKKIWSFRYFKNKT